MDEKNRWYSRVWNNVSYALRYEIFEKKPQKIKSGTEQVDYIAEIEENIDKQIKYYKALPQDEINTWATRRQLVRFLETIKPAVHVIKGAFNDIKEEAKKELMEIGGKIKKDLKKYWRLEMLFGFVIIASSSYVISDYLSKKAIEKNSSLLIQQEGILNRRTKEFKAQVEELKQDNELIIRDNKVLIKEVDLQGKKISEYEGRLLELTNSIDSLQDKVEKTNSSVSVLTDEYGKFSIGHKNLLNEFDGLKKEINSKIKSDNLQSKFSLERESERTLKEFKESLENLLNLEYPE